MKRFWRWLNKPRGAVECEICGKWAYPLEWGGLLHIGGDGWKGYFMYVHPIHTIRHMIGKPVREVKT